MKKNYTYIVSKGIVVALLCCFASSHLAAGVNGTLAGVVTDAQGNTMSGAVIKVLGTTRGACSKANGVYKVINIPAGTYDVQVSTLGRKVVVLKKVVVKPESITERNIMLKDTLTRVSCCMCGGYAYDRSSEDTLLLDDKKPDSVDVPLQRDVQVYPNPTRDMVNITFRTDTNARVRLRLLSVATGEQVALYDAGDLERGNHTLIMNLQTVVSGSYLLLMQSESGEYGYITVMKH